MPTLFFIFTAIRCEHGQSNIKRRKHPWKTEKQDILGPNEY